jgi:hypothetical protein
MPWKPTPSRGDWTNSEKISPSCRKPVVAAFAMLLAMICISRIKAGLPGQGGVTCGIHGQPPMMSGMSWSWKNDTSVSVMKPIETQKTSDDGRQFGHEGERQFLDRGQRLEQADRQARDAARRSGSGSRCDPRSKAPGASCRRKGLVPMDQTGIRRISW